VGILSLYQNSSEGKEIVSVAKGATSSTKKINGQKFPHNFFFWIVCTIPIDFCLQKRNSEVFYRAWKGLFSIIDNTRIDMTAQKVTTYYPPPGHAARVKRNRYLRDHAGRVRAIAAGKIICHALGEAEKITRQKLSAFIADEKLCNAKLERFLVDVDSCSIGREGWLRFGAYQSINPGPFCPVRKKKH